MCHITKGRVAYLLKSSRPLRFERKKPMEHPADYSLLTNPIQTEEVKERNRQAAQTPARHDDDMNIDYRPSYRSGDDGDNVDPYITERSQNPSQREFDSDRRNE